MRRDLVSQLGRVWQFQCKCVSLDRRWKVQYRRTDEFEEDTCSLKQLSSFHSVSCADVFGRTDVSFRIRMGTTTDQ